MKEHGKVDQIGTEQIDQIRVGRTTVKHFGFMGGGEAYWVPMETAFLSMGHSQNDLKEAVAKSHYFPLSFSLIRRDIHLSTSLAQFKAIQLNKHLIGHLPCARPEGVTELS